MFDINTARIVASGRASAYASTSCASTSSNLEEAANRNIADGLDPEEFLIAAEAQALNGQHYAGWERATRQINAYGTVGQLWQGVGGIYGDS